MANNLYEDLRNYYKPSKVKVLFIGESRPQGGTFFYQADSSLYKETQKAFNEFFEEDIFTLDNFKKWNCWLYDICENPVNNITDLERRLNIHINIPKLIHTIETLDPKTIIVCKKKFVESEIRNSSIMDNYCEGESIFFLPFPGQGNQKRYREGLIKAMGGISFA